MDEVPGKHPNYLGNNRFRHLFQGDGEACQSSKKQKRLLYFYKTAFLFVTKCIT
jgi:hypothetical protein